MNTDEHRFLGPGSGLASLGFGSLSGERTLGREERSLGSSYLCLSVSICGCIEFSRLRNKCGWAGLIMWAKL